MRVAVFCSFFLLSLLTAATCVSLALGQASDRSPDLEEGMKPYGSFHGGDIDQVALSSGKPALNIPWSPTPSAREDRER